MKIQGRRPKKLVRRGSRHRFSEGAKAILKKWLADNQHNPFPAPKTKLALADKCNLTAKQVSDWLINYRRRHQHYPQTLRKRLNE